MKLNTAIDRFALKRDKEMTPGARLDWLAAAWEFSLMTARPVLHSVKKRSKTIRKK